MTESQSFELEPQPLREVLQELYLLWCERRREENPNQSTAISTFAGEAEVVEGKEGQIGEVSIARVMRGDRPTIKLDSVDRLLNGLYNEGNGLIDSDEKEYWKERLYAAVTRDVLSNVFSKRLYPDEAIDVPEELLNKIVKDLRGHFRKTGHVFNLDILGSTILSQWKSRKEITFNRFIDNAFVDNPFQQPPGDDIKKWVFYHQKQISPPIPTDLSHLRNSFDMQICVNFELPYAKNLMVSTRARKTFDEMLWSYGITLFLKKDPLLYRNVEPTKNSAVIVMFLIAPSIRSSYVAYFDLSRRRERYHHYDIPDKESYSLTVQYGVGQHLYFIGDTLIHSEEDWTDYTTRVGLCYSAPTPINANKRIIARIPPAVGSPLRYFCQYFELMTFYEPSRVSLHQWLRRYQGN